MKLEVLRPFALAVESVLFTVIVPGTVTIWLPWVILPDGTPLLPATWGFLHYAALPLAGLGLAVYFRCLWDFAVSGRGIPAPVDHPNCLVVCGLYRYVRNPMYLGVLCVLLAEVIFLGSRALLVYTAAWFLIVQGVIVLYEEPGLRGKSIRSTSGTRGRCAGGFPAGRTTVGLGDIVTRTGRVGRV